MNLQVRDEPSADEKLDDRSFADWWRRFLLGQEVLVEDVGSSLRIVDLFSGSGGFGVGAALAARFFGRRATFAAVADTDVDATKAYARSLPVMRRLNQTVAMMADYALNPDSAEPEFDFPPELIIPELEAEVGRVDLLIAGPPCQGHSNLNNHTRRNDPRNDLFISTVAVAVALEARVVVIENVPTVTRSHGDVVRCAQSLFESEGYLVDSGVLRMDDLGGWQTRARYFMIAVKQDAAFGSNSILESWQTRHGKMRSPRREPLPVLWAIEDLADTGGEGIFDTSPVQNKENSRRINYLFDNKLYDLPFEERPDCHKDGTTYTSVYGRMHPDRPAPTITTGIGTPGQGRFIHPTRRRLITPHEAARIQGFPDGYVFDQDGDVSRKALAKWIGDAVPSLLGMSAVAAALTHYFDEEPSLPWELE